MRLVITGLALALAVPLLGGDAGAQPVTTAPLAANEVLLEVNATGSVTSRADLAMLQVQVNVYAPTEEQARRDAEAQVRRITAAARRAGIAAADIEASEINTHSSDMMMTMDTNAMIAVEDAVENAAEAVDMTAGNDMTTASATTMAMGTVTLKLRDMGRQEAVQRAIEEAGASPPSPVYSLSDASGPRREARTRAIAAARADAEAYAAALGMRVARIVRVSERSGLDFFSMMMNQAAWQRSMNLGEQNQREIETVIMLGVDFALAPR